MFLLQGLGTRKWQVTDHEIHEPSLIEDIDLQVLSEFGYVYEWLLEPGDMLYLPPHFGHNGIAMDECMTLSIGYRAPTQAEAIDTVLNALLERGLAKKHYRDTNLIAVEDDHEITQQGMDNLKALLHQTIDDAEPILMETLGKLVTETKPSLVELTHECVTEPTSKEVIEQQFSQGQLLQKSTYHRFAWFENKEGGQLFVAGETYRIKHCTRQQLILLTEN